MKELIWPSIYVFIGGGVGSVFRFWVATLSQHTISSHYPLGTLTVNVIGSFIIGFIISYFETRSASFPFWRLLLVVGFLGGFTTFSSFSWDTITLFRNHETGAAILNIAANMVICLLAAWVGLLVAKESL